MRLFLITHRRAVNSFDVSLVIVKAYLKHQNGERAVKGFQDKYAKCLEEVKTAKNVEKKEADHYRSIKRYEILTIGREEKRIALMKEDNGEIKYYVCYNDSFNILEGMHVARFQND
ncbi:hypothetical protein JTB14_001716 [Gonioctena quinquepunctata]|nr:hypothetical protein JTB14_001716 [Gonioctena quinquepunctata]